MKRTAVFLLMIALCTALCACGQETAEAPEAPAAPAVEEAPTENVVDAPTSYDPAAPVALSAFAAEVSAARQTALEAPSGFEAFSDYLVDDPETKNLVSADEIALMRNGSGEKPETITYEQAVYDADLLARTLKVGYGAYYIFGAEAFDKAYADTLAWLNGRTDISVRAFDEVLQKNYYFMRDAHASVAPVQEDIDGVRRDDCLTYFYCEDAYQQDENGFYKLSGGEKWYYDGCGNDSVTMQPSLTENGDVVYSPVQFCATTDMEAIGTVRLCSGDAVAYEEVTWTAGDPYPNGEGGYFLFDPDYRLEQAGGITYISLRNTDHQRFPKELSAFIKSGTPARNSSAVILDIRANKGGGSDAAYKWFKNFTGTDLELRMASAVRGSVLNGLSDGASTWQQAHITNGAFVANDIPVFVLVDDCTASGGELLMQALRMVENTVIVGSNTAGCSLCGNSGEDMAFKLPYSQIHFNFGSVPSYYNTLENVDDIGFTPDIWCDPEAALDRVLKLISDSGLADEAAAAELASDLYQISLRWHAEFLQEHIGRTYEDIPPDRRFGSNDGVHTVEVKVNGQRVTGFTILENAHPETCELSITPEGDLQVRVKGPGESKFTIGYQGSSASFTWNAMEGPTQYGGPDTITLRWYTDIFTGSVKPVDIEPGTGFGDPTPGVQDIVVLLNGEETADFSIENSNPEHCTVSVTPEGRIVLNSGAGESWLTVTCGDSFARFRWVGTI